MRGSLDFVRVPNSSPGPYGGQICPFISSGDELHLSPRKSSGSRHELPADAITAKQRVPTAISLLIKVFMFLFLLSPEFVIRHPRLVPSSLDWLDSNSRRFHRPLSFRL